MSENSSSISNRPEGLSEDLSVRILQELQALSGRMTTMGEKENSLATKYHFQWVKQIQNFL